MKVAGNGTDKYDGEDKERRPGGTLTKRSEMAGSASLRARVGLAAERWGWLESKLKS